MLYISRFTTAITPSKHTHSEKIFQYVHVCMETKQRDNHAKKRHDYLRNIYQPRMQLLEGVDAQKPSMHVTQLLLPT